MNFDSMKAEMLVKTLSQSIENELKRVNDKFDKLKREINIVDNLPMAIEKLAIIHGNTREQALISSDLISTYANSEFFRNSEVSYRMNYFSFKNKEFSIEFSTSLLRHIKIRRNSYVSYPKRSHNMNIHVDVQRFIAMWNSEEGQLSKPSEKLIEFYLNNIKLKKSGFFTKRNLRKTNEMKNYVLRMENLIRILEEDEIVYEQRLKQYENEYKELKLFLEDLESTIKEFSDNGWNITYENIKVIDNEN